MARRSDSRNVSGAVPVLTDERYKLADKYRKQLSQWEGKKLYSKIPINDPKKLKVRRTYRGYAYFGGYNGYKKDTPNLALINNYRELVKLLQSMSRDFDDLIPADVRKYLLSANFSSSKSWTLKDSQATRKVQRAINAFLKANGVYIELEHANDAELKTLERARKKGKLKICKKGSGCEFKVDTNTVVMYTYDGKSVKVLGVHIYQIRVDGYAGVETIRGLQLMAKTMKQRLPKKKAVPKPKITETRRASTPPRPRRKPPKVLPVSPVLDRRAVIADKLVTSYSTVSVATYLVVGLIWNMDPVKADKMFSKHGFEPSVHVRGKSDSAVKENVQKFVRLLRYIVKNVDKKDLTVDGRRYLRYLELILAKYDKTGKLVLDPTTLKSSLQLAKKWNLYTLAVGKGDYVYQMSLRFYAKPGSVLSLSNVYHQFENDRQLATQMYGKEMGGILSKQLMNFENYLRSLGVDGKRATAKSVEKMNNYTYLMFYHVFTAMTYDGYGGIRGWKASELSIDHGDTGGVKETAFVLSRIFSGLYNDAKSDVSPWYSWLTSYDFEDMWKDSTKTIDDVLYLKVNEGDVRTRRFLSLVWMFDYMRVRNAAVGDLLIENFLSQDLGRYSLKDLKRVYSWLYEHSSERLRATMDATVGNMNNISDKQTFIARLSGLRRKVKGWVPSEGLVRPPVKTKQTRKVRRR